MRVPISAFAPDRSKYDPAFSANIINALPAARGWKPMPSLSEISQALGSACRGSAYVRTASGVTRILAATQTALFELDTTNFTWTDITGSSGPYTGPATGEAWTFTEFGGNLIIHNYNDPPQKYVINTGGTVTDLGGSPPQAKYSWVSGDFLVFGYLNQSVGEKTVYWSEVNDAENWRIGKNGCDFQVLPEGNEIMGGIAENGGFSVIQRSGMQFFPFAPASGFTFTRQVLNPKQGTIAPRSIVSIGPGQFFYLSEDGFFGGADRRPLGAEAVDEWFLEQIDQTYLAEVQGVADPFEKIVWWRYQIPNGQFRLLGYDWQLDRWCTSDLAVGEMVALATPAITWDGLDALYASIDEVTEPFDSRLFSGGRPTFATFNSDNKLAYFTGPPLAATLETAEIEASPTNRAFCNGVRIIGDCSTASVELGTADYHGSAFTFGSASTINRAGLIPLRGDGRLMKWRVNIPAAADWSEISGINADLKVTGKQ